MRRDEAQALREQRAHLVQELRDASAAADAHLADESLTELRADDQEKLDKIEKDLLGVNKRLETHTRTECMATWAPEDAISVNPDGAPKTLNEYRAQDAVVKAADLPEVRQSVYKYLVSGKESLDSEEYRVLSKAASGGGFFVPTELADQIVRALRFLPGGVASLARTLTTSAGETVNIPLNLTHGTAAWVAESGAYTPSDETITNGTLAAFKAATKIIVSEELLTDSEFDLAGFISQEFGERIGALAEAAYISGDGSGKPTGITDAASAVTVSTLPAGQVATPTAAALLAAIYTIPAQYRENLSLLVSDGQWIRLMTMVDSTGRPLWQPSPRVRVAGHGVGHPDLHPPQPRRPRREREVRDRRQLQPRLLDPPSQRRVHAETERTSQ